MLTAVFDSSDEEDVPPHATRTVTTQDHKEAAAADVALSAELSKLSHEYDQEGKSLRSCLEAICAYSVRKKAQVAGAQACEVLSCLGLSPEMFSRGGQETLAHIAATARSLHLQGCEQYMFLVALLQLREQQHSLYCAQVMLSVQTTHSSVSRSYIGTDCRNKLTRCNSG